MTRVLVILGNLLAGVASYDAMIASGLRVNVAFAFAVLIVLIISVVLLSIFLGRVGERGGTPLDR